jgi:hypothetical protein
MIHTAIRDIAGQSIDSIKVTHEIKRSENNHYNIVAKQLVVKLLWGIFLLFILDCYKPEDQIVQNYNFTCIMWLYV